MKKVIEWECEWCGERFDGDNREDAIEHEQCCEQIRLAAYNRLRKEGLIGDNDEEN